MSSLQEDLRSEIERLGPWFHNLHLPDGTQTAPDHWLGDFPFVKWRQIEPFMPQDLSGTTVLDVGCNAGFYSFELARRGAEVTAVDLDERYLAQARWAAERMGLADRVTLRRLQVYELAQERERYDFVWFMGVFYHCRYPLLALDILARKTKRQMAFQTLSMPGEEDFAPPPDVPFERRERLTERDWPKMAFIERRLAGDPTNWWVADPACVEGMLRSCGLNVVARPGHEIYLCEPGATDGLGIDQLKEEEYRAATRAAGSA